MRCRRFGYAERDAGGQPNGARLTLTMASAPSALAGEFDELWQKSLKAIGIRVEFMKQKWPDLIQMGKHGKLQMWRVGWITAYGEGDAFAKMLYGKNIEPTN
jgi:ABC-type oligopeptide transport system substrate-binding subunit